MNRKSLLLGAIGAVCAAILPKRTDAAPMVNVEAPVPFPDTLDSHFQSRGPLTRADMEKAIEVIRENYGYETPSALPSYRMPTYQATSAATPGGLIFVWDGCNCIPYAPETSNVLPDFALEASA